MKAPTLALVLCAMLGLAQCNKLPYARLANEQTANHHPTQAPYHSFPNPSAHPASVPQTPVSATTATAVCPSSWGNYGVGGCSSRTITAMTCARRVCGGTAGSFIATRKLLGIKALGLRHIKLI